VRNNQENLCVLILHGDSEVASENELLGQFDIMVRKYKHNTKKTEMLTLTNYICIVHDQSVSGRARNPAVQDKTHTN